MHLVSGSEDQEGGSLTGNGVQDEETLTMMLLDVNRGVCARTGRRKRNVCMSSSPQVQEEVTMLHTLVKQCRAC